MTQTKTRSQILRTYFILIILAALMLFPLLWLLGTSLKSHTEQIFGFPPQLLPRKPTLNNFREVWQAHPFGRYLFNSTLIAILTVFLNLVSSSLAAYPLARLQFKGRDLIFATIVSTIMIPFQIVMIPLYIIIVRLNLVNSYLGIIFPAIASAFGIFLLRQAFQSVPKELEEAARMDGCTELGLWWHVMIPAVRPALVTLAIFVFIGSWSDFLWPLIAITDPEYYTLPLGVSKLFRGEDLNWRLVAAGSIIAIAPALLFFVFVQRYIIPTETGSGVKG